MNAITEKDTLAKVYQDYDINFRPRKEIGLCLSYEEILEVINSKELLTQCMLAWHFQFYLKQLFKYSWEAIHQDTSIATSKKSEMIEKLKEDARYDSHNQFRALVAMISVTFFLEEINDYQLQDIFDGHSIYDDYCAQIAYNEYLRRKSVGVNS